MAVPIARGFLLRGASCAYGVLFIHKFINKRATNMRPIFCYTWVNLLGSCAGNCKFMCGRLRGEFCVNLRACVRGKLQIYVRSIARGVLR